MFLSCIATIVATIAFALPAGAATTDNVQVQPDKALATAPPVTTDKFIVAKVDKAKKPGDDKKARAAKNKKEGKKFGKAKKAKPKAKKAAGKKWPTFSEPIMA